MNETKKTYAIISGIIALMLVGGLAVTSIYGGKKSAPVRVQKITRTPSKTAAPTSQKSVQAMVRTPSINTIDQSVTVKR